VALSLGSPLKTDEPTSHWSCVYATRSFACGAVRARYPASIFIFCGFVCAPPLLSVSAHFQEKKIQGKGNNIRRLQLHFALSLQIFRTLSCSYFLHLFGYHEMAHPTLEFEKSRIREFPYCYEENMNKIGEIGKNVATAFVSHGS